MLALVCVCIGGRVCVRLSLIHRLTTLKLIVQIWSSSHSLLEVPSRQFVFLLRPCVRLLLPALLLPALLLLALRGFASRMLLFSWSNLLHFICICNLYQRKQTGKQESAASKYLVTYKSTGGETKWRGVAWCGAAHRVKSEFLAQKWIHLFNFNKYNNK